MHQFQNLDVSFSPHGITQHLEGLACEVTGQRFFPPAIAPASSNCWKPQCSHRDGG